MKKFGISFIFLCINILAQAQDVVTKMDGTVIKGRVISFQDNRVMIQQDDETEIMVPRKAVSMIRFNYTDNGVEPKMMIAKGETMSAPQVVPQVKSPVMVVAPKNVIESIGEVTELESRTLLAAPALREKAINSGRVAVYICVNTEGVVTSAKFKAAGSSTLDTDLISLAVENAKEFRFTKGKGEDCGLVTYRFNLD